MMVVMHTGQGLLNFSEHGVGFISSPSWFHIISYLLFPNDLSIAKVILPVLTPELVKIYNIGNSVVDIGKIGCFVWLLCI